MDDLISRQAAIDALFELYEYQRDIDPTEAADLVRQGIFLAEKKIEKLPSAQPERERGKWDTFFSDSYKVHKIGVECSCCGYRTQERTNYCPNCGAKMKEVRDE